ncbi:unnamed protein product [Microthlaspi erraticum]|uniref:DUF4216 domain-containing protein n=1 Tax=Microthlaspi erraticum TaxID=1685480 RepID=A0A6D2IYF0_9BRAS|nr:unnamed protein product [Microthlaspi erraticum]
MGLVSLKITLFKCEWYDPTDKKGTRKSKGGVVDVLSSGKYRKYEPFILASQADQVCYIPYPYVSKPRKCWLNVLKVNPRANILGNYKDKEPTLLQQENDDDVSTTNEDIIIDSLVIREHPTEEIDFDVGDAQGEDEFQCNISSSDEDEYDEDGDEDEDVDHTY